MNGYTMEADAYRHFLEKNPDTENREYLERKVKVFDILASLDRKDIAMIFDTGAYNELTKQYIKQAMEMCNYGKEDISKVLSAVSNLFDIQTAIETLEGVKIND